MSHGALVDQLVAGGVLVDAGLDEIAAVERQGLYAFPADAPQMRRFAEWTPFLDPVCRECSHLPTCLGGCPRNRIDRRDAQNHENCTYYQRIEREVLLFHLGHRAPAPRTPAPAAPPPRRHLPVVM